MKLTHTHRLFSLSQYVGRMRRLTPAPGVTGEGVRTLHVSGRRHPRRGFTLVEVLATLVLIGVVLPVAMNGITLALSAAGNARHSAEAAQLAQTKLNELVLTGDWSLTGTTGDFGTDWPGYTWMVESGTTGSSDYGLTEVRVWVAWQERARQRRLSVATLVSDSSSLSTPALEVIQ